MSNTHRLHSNTRVINSFYVHTSTQYHVLGWSVAQGKDSHSLRSAQFSRHNRAAEAAQVVDML